MDKVPPYFHFYPNDYWSDEKASLLSYEQHGVYMFLLSRQWIEGSIPSDLPTLARLCRLDGGAMAVLWQSLKPCFEKYGDRLINPRLHRERQKLIAYFKSKSNSGKLGASIMWGNKLRRRAQPMASPMAKNGGATATKAITKPITKPKERPPLPPSFLLEDQKFIEAWALWERHRKEKRNTLTSTTKEKQLSFLEKQPDPMACINQSIEKGWVGLFEFKGEVKTNPDVHTCMKYLHNQPFPCGKSANKKIGLNWLCDVHFEQIQTTLKGEKKECVL